MNYLVNPVSYDCPISNQRILRHDDDAVADEVRATLSISLDHAALVQQSRVLPNARILVDDRTLDDSSLTYPDARQALTQIEPHVLKRLVVIITHQDRRLNLHALQNPATQTDDGVRQLRTVDDATVADDRIVDLGLFNLRWRQVT